MSEIHFACLHCGKRLAIDFQAAGMSVRCPDCHGIVTVPRGAPPGRDAPDPSTPQSTDAAEMSRVLKKLEKENSVLRSELHVSEDRRKKIDFDLSDLRIRLDKLNEVYAAAVRRTQECQEETESLKLAHAEAEREWTEKHNQHRTAYETLEKGSRDTAAERDGLQQRLDDAQSENQRISAELETRTQAHDETRRALEALPPPASNDADEPARHEARVHELEKHLSVSEARCEDLTSEVRRARDEIKTLQESLRSSENRLARRAGERTGAEKRTPPRETTGESFTLRRDKMLRKTKPGIEPEVEPAIAPAPVPAGETALPGMRPATARASSRLRGPVSETRPDPFMHIPQGGRGFKVVGIIAILLLAGYLAYTYLGPGKNRDLFGSEGNSLFPDISVPLATDKMKTVQLGESVLVDGVQIDFFRARIDRVAKRSVAGSRSISEKAYLVLDFKMRNAPNNIPVYVTRLWKETDLHIKAGGKIRQAFPESNLALEQVEGDINNAVLEPGKSLEGSLAFELPPDRALEFTLVSNPGFYRRLQERSGPTRDEQLGIPRPPDTDDGYAPISDRLFAITFSREDIHEVPEESAEPPAMEPVSSVKDQTAAAASAR